MAAAPCPLCSIYRPDVDPRQPDRPPVCEGDRWRLARDIAEIGQLHARLVNPDPVEYDNRWYEARDPDGHLIGQQRRRDPLGALGGVAPIPSRTNQPTVSGSRERPAPISLDTADLTGAARQGSIGIRTRGDWARKPGGDPDQIGLLPAATVLEYWAREWREALWPEHHLPPATVPELVEWLLAGADGDNPGVRIDEACDQHPTIDEMATEVRKLRQAFRRSLGETEPQPERIEGAACRGCDLRTLFRRPDDLYRAECASCGLLYSEAEYTTWVEELAGQVRGQRGAEAVRRILQRA